jgi:hypothetical protein
MIPGWFREWVQQPRELRDAQQVVHEDSDQLGYHLMAGGSGAPPRPKPNPLLDIAPEEFWREIEREALS